MTKLTYIPTRFTLITLTITVTAPTSWSDEKAEMMLQYWPPILRQIVNYARAAVKSLGADLEVKAEK